jgi:CBS domain-containing protein
MIRAKYIMCKKSAVKKDATGRDVVFKLMASGCPGLPVVNEGSEVIGMVTMCDMLAASNEKGEAINDLTAEQVMSKVPVTADADTPVEELSKLMVEHNYSVIPIVKGKKLLGVVGGREIVDTYIEPHLYSVFNE